MLPVNDYQKVLYEALKKTDYKVFDEVPADEDLPLMMISDYTLDEGNTKLPGYKIIQSIDLYSQYNGKKEINTMVALALEEAMLSKYFSIDISHEWTVGKWKEKRKESKLDYSIPVKINGKKISDDDKITLRDILKASSGNKTDFMYSVIMNEYVEIMEPDYIRGGLEWLMN